MPVTSSPMLARSARARTRIEDQLAGFAHRIGRGVESQHGGQGEIAQARRGLCSGRRRVGAAGAEPQPTPRTGSRSIARCFPGPRSSDVCGANEMAAAGGARAANWRRPPERPCRGRRGLGCARLGRCVADEPVLPHCRALTRIVRVRCSGHEFDVDEIRIRRQRRIHWPDRQRAYAAGMTRRFVAAGRLIRVPADGALDCHPVPVEQFRSWPEIRSGECVAGQHPRDQVSSLAALVECATSNGR